MSTPKKHVKKTLEISTPEACEHRLTRVISTWRAGYVVRRRRVCLDCRERFSTKEKLR